MASASLTTEQFDTTCWVSTCMIDPRARLFTVSTASISLLDERELVKRARVDPDSFAKLYRHFLSQVHGFAYRRTGSQQAAEDITSATFEKAYKNLARFKSGPDGFAPWLMRIAANETISYYRGEARPQGERGQQAMARLHEPVSEDDLDRVIERACNETDELMRDAMDRLTPRYQRAISLRYLAELDATEAARSMGLAKPAFAVVLSRAMKALRREIERERERSSHDE